jgi:hypothetical protein
LKSRRIGKSIVFNPADLRAFKRRRKAIPAGNRSLQGEAKSILELSAKMTMEEARERASKIRASFGKKKFTDSVDLIREDRNR